MNYWLSLYVASVWTFIKLRLLNFTTSNKSTNDLENKVKVIHQKWMILYKFYTRHEWNFESGQAVLEISFIL